MLPLAMAGLGVAGGMLDSYGKHKEEEARKKQMRVMLGKRINDARAERNRLGISSQEAMNRAGQMLAKYKDNPQMAANSTQIYDSTLRYNEGAYNQATKNMLDAQSEMSAYGKSKFNLGSSLGQAALSGLTAYTMAGDSFGAGTSNIAQAGTNVTSAVRPSSDISNLQFSFGNNGMNLTGLPKQSKSLFDYWQNKANLKVGGY